MESISVFGLVTRCKVHIGKLFQIWKRVMTGVAVELTLLLEFMTGSKLLTFNDNYPALGHMQLSHFLNISHFGMIVTHGCMLLPCIRNSNYSRNKA